MINKEEMENRIKLTQQQICKYAKSSVMTSTFYDSIMKSATSKMITKYSKEEIKTYLENPSSYQEQLRDVVDYLVAISPQYSKLCDYIPNLALITPVVIPNSQKYKKNVSKKEKDFLNACETSDKFNIKDISYQILREVFRYGIFFGIIQDGVYSNYMKKLPPNYCKIVGIGEQGFIFAFDFSYFGGANEYLLDTSYPPNFKRLYNEYKAGKVTIGKLPAKWKIIEMEEDCYPVCVKYDTSNIEYSIPPLINVVEDIYDLQEYKSLNKAKTVKDNYSIIGVKVPLTKDGDTDQFAVSDDMVEATSIQLDESLPDYIGYAIFPGMDVELMKASSPTDTTTDTVLNATKNIFNSLGFADALFGVNNDSASSLAFSTKVDEQMLFPIYRQIERIFDYKLKMQFKDRMKIKLLDTSWFNLEDILTYYKDQVALGSPLLTVMPLLLGYSQIEVYSMNEANSDIWDVVNTWNPPKSSYNVGDGEEVGNQKKSTGKLTDNGEKSRDNKGTAKV